MTETAHDSSHTELVPGSCCELLQVAVPLMLSAGTLSIMNMADRAMLTGCWEQIQIID